MRRAALRADILLLFAAVVWGAGFIAQKLGMDHVGPMLFTALRLLTGAIVLLPIVWLRTHERDSRGSRAWYLPRIAIIPLILVSLVLLAGFSAQQIGIDHTTASKAGFITALYVVFTPIVGLLANQRAARATWLGALLALLGLTLLSVNLDEPLHIQPGDALVLLAAFLWAIHVVMLGSLAPKSDPIRLAFWQFVIAGFGALAIALAVEDIEPQAIWNAAGAILYSAVFATALAFTIQIIAQRSAPASHVAILLSLEAVFAAIFAAILLKERMTDQQILGAAIVFAAILVSQLRRQGSKAAHHLAEDVSP